MDLFSILILFLLWWSNRQSLHLDLYFWTTWAYQACSWSVSSPLEFFDGSSEMYIKLDLKKKWSKNKATVPSSTHTHTQRKFSVYFFKIICSVILSFLPHKLKSHRYNIWSPCYLFCSLTIKEKQKLGMCTMWIRQMKIFVHMEMLFSSISTPF